MTHIRPPAPVVGGAHPRAWQTRPPRRPTREFLVLRVHDAELEELEDAAAVLLGGATGGARAARAAGALRLGANRSGLAKVRHSPRRAQKID